MRCPRPGRRGWTPTPGSRDGFRRRIVSPGARPASRVPRPLRRRPTLPRSESPPGVRQCRRSTSASPRRSCATATAGSSPLRPATWDEALDRVAAEGFRTAGAAHGSRTSGSSPAAARPTRCLEFMVVEEISRRRWPSPPTWRLLRRRPGQERQARRHRARCSTRGRRRWTCWRRPRRSVDHLRDRRAVRLGRG